MRDFEEVRAAVLAKGYKFFENDLSINMIWERTSDVFTNQFTDHLNILYFQNKKPMQLVLPATTKPGLKGSILEPITVENVTGTAIIIPNQYRGSHQFLDTYTEFSKYPYFRQRGVLDYWRDGDKDLELDRVQRQEDRVFHTHVHRMSNNGTYGSRQVNNFSLGCMGAPEPEFKRLLEPTRECVKKYGDMFTQTILETIDFK